MKTPNQTEWLECGQGRLLHPVTQAPVTTEVVELKGFGRIFEVHHYGNEPEQTQRLILAAPAMLAALQGVVRELGVHHAPDCRCQTCRNVQSAIAQAT